MRRASEYGAFAHMLALEGDNRKTDELYCKLLETDYSKSSDRQMQLELAPPTLEVAENR